MDNSIDLAEIYGFRNGCPASGCVPTGEIIPGIPSLEQIAAYNLLQAEQRARQNPELIEQRRREVGALNGIEPQTTNQGMAAAGSSSPAELQPLTGMPTPTMIMRETGSAQTNNVPATNGQIRDISEYPEPYRVTPESIQYLNGFLRSQIGRLVEIEFLIGTNDTVKKTGYLLGIGANYILMSEEGTNHLLTADFYNIKFVKIFYPET